MLIRPTATKANSYGSQAMPDLSYKHFSDSFDFTMIYTDRFLSDAGRIKSSKGYRAKMLLAASAILALAACDSESAEVNTDVSVLKHSLGGGSDCVEQSYLGKLYLFCDDNKTWLEARSACQVRGMDLVVIGDQAENDFVLANLSDDALIGASDIKVEGDWVWAYSGNPLWKGDEAGSPVGAAFANWQSGEPDSSSRHCAKISDDDGEWSDSSCSNAREYVCEAVSLPQIPAECEVEISDRKYLFCDLELEWEEARKACLFLGLNLVSIETEEQNEFVRGNIQDTSWIGASDSVAEGDWTWAGTGTAFWSGGQVVGAQFVNWHSGEPDGDNEDCARIKANGEWWDGSCTKEREYVCAGAVDCGNISPNSFATHLERLWCGNPSVSQCRLRVQARANADRQAAARQYMVGLFTPGEYLGLARDRSRKIHQAKRDSDLLDAICDGDDDFDLVPNSVDQCPNTPGLTPTDDLGCIDETIHAAPPRAEIDALIASMGVFRDLRCAGAPTPTPVVASWLIHQAQWTTPGSYYIQMYPVVTNQPANCEVFYEVEARIEHADLSVSFATMRYSNQGDRYTDDYPSTPLLVVKSKLSYGGDWAFWGEDATAASIRVRTANGNGQRSSWSESKRLVVFDPDPLNVVIPEP